MMDYYQLVVQMSTNYQIKTGDVDEKLLMEAIHTAQTKSKLRPKLCITNIHKMVLIKTDPQGRPL